MPTDNWQVKPENILFHHAYSGNGRAKNVLMAKGAYHFTKPASRTTINVNQYSLQLISSVKSLKFGPSVSYVGKA